MPRALIKTDILFAIFRAWNEEILISQIKCHVAGSGPTPERPRGRVTNIAAAVAGHRACVAGAAGHGGAVDRAGHSHTDTGQAVGHTHEAQARAGAREPSSAGTRARRSLVRGWSRGAQQGHGFSPFSETSGSAGMASRAV